MKAEPEIHALLVGIDHYLPKEVPAAPAYPDLGGCVHDVQCMRDFLARLDVPEERIRLLLSPPDDLSDEPRGPAEDRPTHANLTAALDTLVEIAAPGRQIVIHYSGHGGRAETRNPHRDHRGLILDECLVPMDIAQSTAVPYLRDWELAVYLRRMLERGAWVTLLLDCCHSGGLTRGPLSGEKLRSRGGEGIDTTARPDSRLPPLPPLAGERGVGESRAWQPLGEKFALLAACRPQEKAMEDAFDGHQSSGAMTHWLMDTLNGQGGQELSYREIHQRLLGRIHCRFPSQTPVLEGDVDRRFLGLERLPTLNGVTVLRAQGSEGEDGLLLATGSLHAVGHRARFTIYRAGVRGDVDLEEGRRALVELTDLGPGESSARIVETFSPEPIETGDRAVLEDPGETPLRRVVRLFPESAADCASDAQKERLQEIRQRLAREGGFLTLEVGGEGAEGFEVHLGLKGSLSLHAPGGEPLPDTPSPATPEQAVQWLTHLAKFRNVQSLRNTSYRSPLRGKIQVEARCVPRGWNGEDPTTLPRLGEPGSTALRQGDELYLRIRNTSGLTLNIGVLDLQPGWSIELVHPPPGGGLSEALDPGATTEVWQDIYLPRPFERPVDLFKIVASTEPLDLLCLRLPALGESHGNFRGQAKGPVGSLQSLMDAMAIEAPTLRHGRSSIARDSWTVAEVEVRVADG